MIVGDSVWVAWTVGDAVIVAVRPSWVSVGGRTVITGSLVGGRVAVPVGNGIGSTVEVGVGIAAARRSQAETRVTNRSMPSSFFMVFSSSQIGKDSPPQRLL